MIEVRQRFGRFPFVLYVREPKDASFDLDGREGHMMAVQVSARRPTSLLQDFAVSYPRT